MHGWGTKADGDRTNWAAQPWERSGPGGDVTRNFLTPCGTAVLVPPSPRASTAPMPGRWRARAQRQRSRAASVCVLQKSGQEGEGGKAEHCCDCVRRGARSRAWARVCGSELCAAPVRSQDLPVCAHCSWPTRNPTASAVPRAPCPGRVLWHQPWGCASAGAWAVAGPAPAFWGEKRLLRVWWFLGVRLMLADFVCKCRCG